MWRCWSGYKAALLILFSPAAVKQTLCCGHSNTLMTVFLLLITSPGVEIILCSCFIVYKGGQSPVCTWLFRWWFTYILSSWVTRVAITFPFHEERKKVAIYGFGCLDKLSSSWILLWAWCLLPLAFNAPQLFSNYSDSKDHTLRNEMSAPPLSQRLICIAKCFTFQPIESIWKILDSITEELSSQMKSHIFTSCCKKGTQRSARGNVFVV